jgi:hypothetical protein
MAYQRALNEKVVQLLVPPEKHPGKPPESCCQRRARQKEMKESMAALDAMSPHCGDNAFFDINTGSTAAPALSSYHTFCVASQFR